MADGRKLRAEGPEQGFGRLADPNMAEGRALPTSRARMSPEHATGNERRWWQEHKIDPLAVAIRLWRESQHLPASDHNL